MFSMFKRTMGLISGGRRTLGAWVLAAAVAAGATATTAGRCRAGALPGPKMTAERVAAHTRDHYFVTFAGGKIARVAVSGDGDTDLDLYVYDENGNLVASDVGTTDRAVATWTPRWTGPFTIRVVNLGNVYNEYRITTN